MDATAQAMFIAALLGLLGQAARALIGLLKQLGESRAEGRQLAQDIEVQRLCASLLLGALAGWLAWLALHTLLDVALEQLREGPVLFALITAGYSGADFVEGLLRRPGKD